MTRLEMEAVINGGGVVLFNGKRYSTVLSLPTQEEIDAVYATADIGPVVVSVDAVGTEVAEITSRLPADLDGDGGLKVHLQNPEDISGGGGVGLTDTELRAAPVAVSSTQLPASLVDGGVGVTLLNPEDIAGGGGGGGLTNTELRATPVPVSGFPAVQPVSDNGGLLSVDDGGGSLTVDGPLTDTQLRATAVPVSGPLTDTQLRATAVPVSNSAVGATTDAEATGDGSNIGLLKRLRTLIGTVITTLGAGLPAALGSSGGVKVDVLSGAGGASMGAEVVARASASIATGFSTSDITNTGYRGIIVYYNFTAGAFSGSATNWQIEEKNPLDGTYNVIASSTTNASNTAYKGFLRLYPGLLGTSAAATGQNVNGVLPRTFRITLINLGSQTMTTGAYYTLIP